VINKFRGDIKLFDGGITAIGERTRLRCFGVVPHFDAAQMLPAEDSMALTSLRNLRAFGEAEGGVRPDRGALRVAVPLLPRIANFDDLDPLRGEPAVDLLIVPPGQPLPRDTTLILLPGSKATLSDLAFLRQQGWDIDILAHRRHGGHVIGLCGGYQMLGRHIADPDGIEGPAGAATGLGLLDIETLLSGDKTLRPVTGTDIAAGTQIAGYEMHVGITTGPGLRTPMLRLTDGPDGAVSADGRVAGCYVHGLFASNSFRAAFLARLGSTGSGLDYDRLVETTLDQLADHLETHLDLDALLAAARAPGLTRAA
jgi:adenosylcobyric acid synthase